MVPYLKIRHWQRASNVKVGQPEWGTANPMLQCGLNVPLLTHPEGQKPRNMQGPWDGHRLLRHKSSSSTNPSLQGKHVSLQAAQHAGPPPGPPSSSLLACPVPPAGRRKHREEKARGCWTKKEGTATAFWTEENRSLEKVRRTQTVADGPLPHQCLAFSLSNCRNWTERRQDRPSLLPLLWGYLTLHTWEKDALSSNQGQYNPHSSLYFSYPVSLAGACDGRWQRPWENSAWSMTVPGCCVLTSIYCSAEPFQTQILEFSWPGGPASK